MSVKCPKCGSSRAKVKDTRPYEATKNGETFSGVRRNYMCMTCGERYFTREVFVPDDIYKSSKSRRAYLTREETSRMGYTSLPRDAIRGDKRRGA